MISLNTKQPYISNNNNINNNNNNININRPNGENGKQLSSADDELNRKQKLGKIFTYFSYLKHD